MKHFFVLLRMGIWFLLCVSCVSVKDPSPQHVEVLKKVGPVTDNINLAIVGPPNYASIEDSNNRWEATCLAFTDAKSGRILKDLRDELPTGYLVSGSWETPQIDPSPDKKHVAVMVRERRNFVVRIFVIHRGSFQTIRSFRQADVTAALIKVFGYSSALAEANFYTSHNGDAYTKWSGNDEITVHCESEYGTRIDPNIAYYKPENMIMHRYSFDCTYHIANDEARFMRASGTLDGKTKEISRDKMVWFPDHQTANGR